MAGDVVGRLVSVNVGMPRDVAWQGRTVHTAVWKDPVDGPRMVRRLNVDGDGQGDLGGHGGEMRAVFVYQLDSYRHWEAELGRDDFVPGQFGENFTVEGLADDVVCIGDRYRIGEAVFEVTQPRVTCFRVGIRMDDPRIPALLVAHHRPGFYLRVLTEGEVRAGDEILKVAAGPEGLTVAEVDAPALPARPFPRGRAARPAGARSQPGVAGLLPGDARPGRRRATGNAGLAATSPPPAWPGFRPLVVSRIDRESDSVVSVHLDDPEGVSVPAALPGQYLTLRLPTEPGRAAAAAQLLALGTARRGRLPHQRQARGVRRGQRVHPHAPARRRPARGRRAPRHLHAPAGRLAGAPDQRRRGSDARARHAARPRGRPLRARGLVAPRRPQRLRALVRRGGPLADRGPAQRAPAHLLQPPRPRRHRGRRLPDGGASVGARPRGARAAAGRGGLPLRARRPSCRRCRPRSPPWGSTLTTSTPSSSAPPPP